MIKGKIKYKKPKLTIEQQAVKKAIRPIAKNTANLVKGSVPKGTGALKFAVGYRIISRKGWSAAVIGIKSKYTKNVRGKEKIPNLYAMRQEMKKHFIERHINGQRVDELLRAAAEVLEQLLRTNGT